MLHEFWIDARKEWFGYCGRPARGGMKTGIGKACVRVCLCMFVLGCWVLGGVSKHSHEDWLLALAYPDSIKEAASVVAVLSEERRRDSEASSASYCS